MERTAYKYTLLGIEVLFPFKAYQCQLLYMEKVIQCLEDSQKDRATNGTENACRRNALLESPTGTGKTLCLLCASYAWLLDFKKKAAGVASFPKIIFSSRTHSQLSKAVDELKHSPYSPVTCVLGSRDQLCVNPEALSAGRGTALNNCCQRLIRSRNGCEYYSTYKVKKEEKSVPVPKTADIEDLVMLGRKENICPFFFSRDLLQDAEIIFTPYNYLIDPKFRKRSGINVKDNIIIFDEAHNIEKTCTESASFDFHCAHIGQAIGEIMIAIKSVNEYKENQFESKLTITRPVDELLQALNTTKDNLLDFEEFIEEVEIPKNQEGLIKAGDWIVDVLAEAQVKTSTYEDFISNLRDAITMYEAYSSGKHVATGLKSFVDIIQHVFDPDSNQDLFADSFRLFLSIDRKIPQIRAEVKEMYSEALSDRDKRMKISERSIGFWCFNPGLALLNLRKDKPHAFILTSGTLSPMDSFAYELGINFSIRLENQHVINTNQIHIMATQTGPSGVPLNSSFGNRDSNEYQIEVGNVLLNLARIVPDGLLVFFSSRNVMERCLQKWNTLQPNQMKPLYDSIGKYKKIFVEPTDNKSMQQCMADYEDFLANGPPPGNTPQPSNGAALFAVCRGRISEGLDFADRSGRAVVIVGLPFPPKENMKVKLKREYLDMLATKAPPTSKPLKGNDWYTQEASRAVNQAIGRIIRHRNDYGAIILCDERFATQYQREQISRWLRRCIKVTNNFGDVTLDTTQFFKRAMQSFGRDSELLKAAQDEKKDTQEHTQIVTAVTRFIPGELTSTQNDGTGVKSVLSSSSTTMRPAYSQLSLQQQYRERLERSSRALMNSLDETKKITTDNKPLFNNASLKQNTAPTLGHQYKTPNTPPKITRNDAPVTPPTHISPPKTVTPDSKPSDVTAPPEQLTPPAPAKTTPPDTKTSPNSAQTFLNQARKILTPHEYEEFKDILKSLKKTNKGEATVSNALFDKLTRQLLVLFSGEKAVLLQGFEQFVTGRRRGRYKELVAQGVPDDDDEVMETTKPASSGNGKLAERKRTTSSQEVPKKRPAVDLLTGAASKRIRLPSYVSDAKPTPPPQPVRQDPTPIVVDIPLTLEADSMMAEPPSSTNPTGKVPSCTICQEPYTDPHAAQCGHICCLECWTGWLKQKLECPICKEKVRPKRLTRIFI